MQTFLFHKLSNKNFFLFVAFLGFIANTLCAYSTLGYYHQDEHYQILEFINYLLNKTPEDKMVWEYSAQIRPWLQPFSYFLSLKFISIFYPLNDPFVTSFILRLESCLFTFIGQCIFSLALFKIYKGGKIWRISLIVIFLFYFFPFLAARTSSENISSTFIILSFSTFIFSIKDKIFHISQLSQNLSLNLGFVFLTGILSGLAFEVRFQSAFFILGFTLWILLNCKNKIQFLILFNLGIILSVILGTMIDSYCYGKFVFAPWNYFDFNLLQGVAANFGVSPFYHYVEIIFDYFPPPIGAILILSLIISFTKFNKNIFFWSFFSFFLFHSFISHKEERFLFPIFILTIPLVCQSLIYIIEKINENRMNNNHVKIFLACKILLHTSILIIATQSFVTLIFTIYKFDNINYSYFNTFGQRFNHYDLKSLEFLDKKVELPVYYGFDKDIQCDAMLKNGACDLKRYFYIKNEHKFVHLNSYSEYEKTFDTNDLSYYNYLYINKSNIDFLTTEFYKNHCQIVYLSRSIPIIKNKNYAFQNSVALHSVLSHKHWFNRGYAEIFMKCKK